MKVGADRKRLMLLGGLALVGGYVLWSNVFSSDSASTPAASAPSVTPSPAPTVIVPSSQSDAARVTARRNRSERASAWNPGIDRKEIIDPVKVDPTLRLDLLAKVQQVELNGAQRNLFQFGEAEKPAVVATKLPAVPKIALGGKPPSPVAPPGPPPVPTAPPIALKYYGYSNPRASTHKRAFFLDGEDIIVASEGEMIKRRYRLVKIGVNSVTMEDTQFKSEQTLPLAEEAVG